MSTIEEIRRAMQRIHRKACDPSEAPYMSIPADPKRDADLVLVAAIDELERLRVAMDFASYQHDAARTLALRPLAEYSAAEFQLKLAVMGLGVAGEAGEVADLIKKHVGHGHELDEATLAKELGDVLWYVAALATMNGLSLGDVARTNIAKLRLRYPEGFTEAASQARVDQVKE